MWSHHYMADRWGDNGNSDRAYFHGLQNHCNMVVDVTVNMNLKDTFSLEEKLLKILKIKIAY